MKASNTKNSLNQNLDGSGSREISLWGLGIAGYHFVTDSCTKLRGKLNNSPHGSVILF